MMEAMEAVYRHIRDLCNREGRRPISLALEREFYAEFAKDVAALHEMRPTSDGVMFHGVDVFPAPDGGPGWAPERTGQKPDKTGA